MSQKGFDPVEEAKVPMPAAKKQQQFKAKVDEPLPLNVESAPKAAPRVVVDVPIPPELLKKYRVMKDQNVMFGSVSTTVRVGQIIDPAGFGPDAIRQLFFQKVELEEVA